MTLDHLRYRIKHVNDKYPWSMSPNILLMILLVSLFMGLIMVGYFLYRIYKMRSHLRSLKDLKNFFNGTADNTQLNELRTQLKNLPSPVELQRLVPRSPPITPTRLQNEQPPTPPARPSTSHENVPLQELPSSKSLEYAVHKLGHKGLDVRKYRAFLQKQLASKTTSQT